MSINKSTATKKVKIYHDIKTDMISHKKTRALTKAFLEGKFGAQVKKFNLTILNTLCGNIPYNTKKQECREMEYILMVIFLG